MKTDISAIKNNRISSILFAVILGLFFAIPVNLFAANYDSGIFEFQQKLAKGGNAQAQYKLATMYESGRGVSKDIKKAKEWYKKSAANKFKAANHRLTFLDVKTTGFKPSHKPWYKALVSDAQKGDGEAMFILGDMHEHGVGVKPDLKKAQAYYKRSSGAGNIDAEHRLDGIEQSLSEKKTAKRKQQEAQQKAKAEEEVAKKRKAEKARKKREAKTAKAQSKRNSQLRAEQERKKLEAERRRLAQEKRMLIAQQKALEEKETAAAQAKQKKAEDDKFESDLCSGRAARFRTQCK